MTDTDVDQLLGELRKIRRSIEHHEAKAKAAYERRIPVYERLRALGVTNVRIGEAAGCTDEAVVLALRKARRQREEAEKAARAG